MRFRTGAEDLDSSLSKTHLWHRISRRQNVRSDGLSEYEASLVAKIKAFLGLFYSSHNGCGTSSRFRPVAGGQSRLGNQRRRAKQHALFTLSPDQPGERVAIARCMVV